MYSYRFKTNSGYFNLQATSRGLYSLQFGKGPKDGKLTEAPLQLKQLARKLSSYLDGKTVDFRKVPIDWLGYTPFKRRVLEKLRRIPRGKTASYQWLARQAGKPEASRAVGQVLRCNRLPIILPCHRVLPKNGGLGGFSKGATWKKRLLKLERARVDITGEAKRATLTGKKWVL